MNSPAPHPNPSSPTSSLSSSQTHPPRHGKQPVIPSHSHYLQSKVVRARERIEAELKIAEEEDAAAAVGHEIGGSGSGPPPPPPEGGPGGKTS